MRLEQGRSFRRLRSRRPPDNDPWVCRQPQGGRYRHFYFYLYDEGRGACGLRVGSFLPFVATAWINGHGFIARRLAGRGVAFTQRDNAFTACPDPQALQAAADALGAEASGARPNYWTAAPGPEVSRRARARVGRLRRAWGVPQAGSCLNWVFGAGRRRRQLLARSGERSLRRLAADRLSQLFGGPRPRRLAGRWQVVRERFGHAQHALRAYWRPRFPKQDGKWQRFLRLEATRNALKDFGRRKSLKHWPGLRPRLRAGGDRLAAEPARPFNVHGEFDLLGRRARPGQAGKTKLGGLRLEPARTLRRREGLLQVAGGPGGGWTARERHARGRGRFELRPADDGLGALRYDLRKGKAHGLGERVGNSYRGRLTAKGPKVAGLMALLRKRIYGPLAHSAFGPRPARTPPELLPDCRWERACPKVDAAMDQLIQGLAA